MIQKIIAEVMYPITPEYLKRIRGRSVSHWYMNYLEFDRKINRIRLEAIIETIDKQIR